LQVVSNLEGGIVDAILVRTGQQVREGQELVRLNQTLSGSELGSGEATLGALRAKIARLERGRGGSPAYPAATSAASANQIAIERALYAARMANLSSINAAGEAGWSRRSARRSSRGRAYQARVSAREAARYRARRRSVPRRPRDRAAPVARRAESAAAVARARPRPASAACGEGAGGVAEARSVLVQQREDWRSTAASELAAARAEMAARQQALPALADRVQRTSVKAPLDGRINRVLVTTVGGSVGPGAPMVELAPDRETLLVEAMVLPKDIGRFASASAPKSTSRPMIPRSTDRSAGASRRFRPTRSRTSGRGRATTSCKCAPTAIARGPGASWRSARA
jgi:adhesin transport system membrane fusion protein